MELINGDGSQEVDGAGALTALRDETARYYHKDEDGVLDKVQYERPNAGLSSGSQYRQ